MPAPELLPVNPFKRGLREGKTLLGLWLTLESPNATEIVAGSGYDWLLLDLEHTTVDLSNVVQHLRAARGGTAEVVVRIPSHDPVLIKRLLDAGARSLMVPMVESAADMRRMVAATRYPPDGMRGMAGSSRANNFSRIPSYLDHYHEELCVIAQIESGTAIAAISEIGGVNGVDGLFIGPNDLAASMGFVGRPGAPAVRAAIDGALTAIRQTGKAPGILNFNPSEARSLVEAGFRFLAVSSDSSLLARRSEALLAEFER